MELPVPTHLRNFLLINKKLSKEKKLVAKLQCCGHNVFTVSKSQNDYVHIIKATCAICKKEIIIFDSRKHGWDGYVCQLFADEKPSIFEKVSDNSLFEVKIFIQSEGKKDFIKEACEDIMNDAGFNFMPTEWVNAFSVITISLVQKNKRIKFFSFETM